MYKYINIFEFEIFSKFPVAVVITKNNGNPSSVEYNINVNWLIGFVTTCLSIAIKLVATDWSNTNAIYIRLA